MVQQINYTDNLRQGRDKINDNFTEVEDKIQQIDDRVDTIISDPTPGKDPELVDIRTPDPSYTPLEPMSTAGGMTRDMQRQFVQLENEIINLGLGAGVTPRLAEDLNNEFDNGWVRIDFNVTLNAPPVGFAWGVCRIDRRNASAVYQTAYRTDGVSVRIFSRKYNAGTWSDWVEIITDAVLKSGSGSPEGKTASSPGTLYRRTDTGELWVKKTGTGNTGWGQVTVS